MVTASLTGFLKTALIIIAFYFVLKVIGRLLMPWMAKKAKDKMSERMQEEMRKRQRQNDPQRKEGEVTIEYTSDKNKSQKKGNAAGDYVDFEELD